MTLIAERTGWRAFGLVPFFADAAHLPAEDAFGLGAAATPARGRRDHRRAASFRASPISTISIRCGWSRA